MKVTDYAPRAAPFDAYLSGFDLVGIEIGVDVGAHAEAMLTHCSIKKLYLVDSWEQDRFYWYCRGRLETKGWQHRIEMMSMTSKIAAEKFQDLFFDFIYIDQRHDYESVKSDLVNWWPKLKKKGMLGYRNYAKSNPELVKAVDEFVIEQGIERLRETGEIILYK